MKAKGVPSTPFLLMLLSVVAVVTCTQPEAMVPHPGGAIIPQQDTPTSVDSNHNEERVSFSSVKRLVPHFSEIKSKVQELKNSPVIQGIKFRFAGDRMKYLADIFHICKVHDVETNLFGSWQYQEFSTIVFNAFIHEDRALGYIARQLMEHYKEKLFPLLSDTQLDNAGREMTKKIEDALVNYWVGHCGGELANLARNRDLQLWYKWAEENKKEPAIELKHRLRKIYIDEFQSLKKPETFVGDAKTIALAIVAVSPFQSEYKALELDEKVSINALLTSERFEKWVKIVKDDGEANLGEVVLATLRKRCDNDYKLITELYVPDMATEDVRGAVVKALINEWTQSKNDVTYVLQKLGNKSPYSEALRSPKLHILKGYLSKREITDTDAIALATLLYENGSPYMDELPTDIWLKKWYNAKKDAQRSAAPVLVPLIKLNDEDKPANTLRSAGETEDVAFAKSTVETAAELLKNPFLTKLYQSSTNEQVFGKLLVERLRPSASDVDLLTTCYESNQISWLVPIVEQTLLDDWGNRHLSRFDRFKNIVWVNRNNDAYQKRALFLWMRYVEQTALKPLIRL